MASNRSFLKTSLFIVVIDVFIILVIELGMRALGLGRPVESFTEDKGPDGSVTVTYSGNPIRPSFAAKRRPGTFRVFCFGGSTMLGFPYHPRSSFSGIFEWMAEKANPDLNIEVINLAKPGADSHDVLWLMEKALSYEPDLILLYTGQNEFLRVSLISEARHPRITAARDFLSRHSRIYQAAAKYSYLAVTAAPALIAGDQDILDALGGIAEGGGRETDEESVTEWRSDKEIVFSRNLERIFELARKDNIPLICFSLAVNMKDWPPLSEPYPAGLSGPEKDELKRSLEKADDFLARGEIDAAEEILRELDARTTGHALTEFMRGRLMEKQGLRSEALEQFRKSRELEIEQHRGPPSFNRMISRLAEEKGIPLIDTEAILVGEAKGAPGFDFFVDHCHPNLRGQVLIARKLYEEAGKLELVPGLKQTIPDAGETELEIMSDFQIDREFIKERKLWLGIDHALNRDLPDNNEYTIRNFGYVINADPLDPLPRIALGLIRLIQGQDDFAIKNLDELMLQNQDSLDKCLKRYFSPGIRLDGSFLMAKIRHEPWSPPLAGMILVRGSIPGESEEALPRTPLDQFNRFWQWSGGSWMDVTDKVEKRLKQRPVKLGQLGWVPEAYNLKISPGISSYSRDLKADAMPGDDACFQIAGPDPFIVFGPLSIDPVVIEKAGISLKLKLIEEEGEAFADLYWATGVEPEFSEARKFSFKVKTDGSPHNYRLALGENPGWVLSDTVTRLRLDPASSFPGEFCLDEMILSPYPPEGRN